MSAFTEAVTEWTQRRDAWAAENVAWGRKPRYMFTSPQPKRGRTCVHKGPRGYVVEEDGTWRNLCRGCAAALVGIKES